MNHLWVVEMRSLNIWSPTGNVRTTRKDAMLRMRYLRMVCGNKIRYRVRKYVRVEA